MVCFSLSSGCIFNRVGFDQGGFSSGCAFISVFLQGAFLPGWIFIIVFFLHQGGYIQQGGLSSGCSHQGGFLCFFIRVGVFIRVGFY